MNILSDLKNLNTPPPDIEKRVSTPTNPEIKQDEEIFRLLYKAIENELAGVILFNHQYTQACGVGTFSAQTLAEEETQHCLDKSRECAKFAIVLFGTVAASNIPKSPCLEMVNTLASISNIRSSLEVAYNWTAKTRELYCNLGFVVKDKHPDIAHWSLSCAKERLELFYKLQSLLS